MLREFREFALRGNVLDMAVGIIIGAAFTTIVQSLVNDILMPPLGVLMGGVDFSEYFINLSGEPVASIAMAKEAGIPVISYGLFINAVIKFAIVAFAVFLLIRQMNRLRRRLEGDPKPETPSTPPPPSADVVLLTEIRDLLKAGRPQ